MLLLANINESYFEETLHLPRDATIELVIRQLTVVKEILEGDKQNVNHQLIF